MPSKEEHLVIIEHNLKALARLSHPLCSDFSEYTDWSETMIFYMTLHYIHAYLAINENKHPGDHSELQRIIGTVNNLKPIYSKYRSLQDDSRKARYDGMKFSVYEMRNNYLKSFKDIQNQICDLLGIETSKRYDLYPMFPSC